MDMETGNKYQRQLLHDVNAEDVVLSSLVENNGNIYSLDDADGESLFYDGKNRTIYNAIRQIIAKGEKADVLTVSQWCMSHNKGVALSELISRLDQPTANARYQLAILKELKWRRQIWKACVEAQRIGYDASADLDVAVSNLRKAVDGISQGNGGIVTLRETAKKLKKQVEDNRAGISGAGIKTGFSLIDKRGGFHAGDLVIIAGETSQGKTALSICMATNMAAMGTGIAFYSMEMTAEQLAARIISPISQINSKDIMYTPLTDAQIVCFDGACKKIAEEPIYFDEKSTSSVRRIVTSIRVLNAKYGISVAIVDYLQILGRNQRVDNTEQFYGDVTRTLKNLAKELGIVIIALSQLSRDRNNPEPTISRLRASGQIEEAADNIILIYRPSVYQRKYPKPYKDADTVGTAELILAKGRNIGTGSCIVGFKPEYTYFYELGDNVPTSEPDDDDPF